MALVTMKAPIGTFNAVGDTTGRFYTPNGQGFFIVDDSDQEGFEDADWILVNTNPSENSGLPLPPAKVTVSRSTLDSDNARALANDTEDNLNITVEANTITTDLKLIQLGIGTLTAITGDGVTFIGEDVATASPGDVVTIQCADANVFVVTRVSPTITP